MTRDFVMVHEDMVFLCVDEGTRFVRYKAEMVATPKGNRYVVRCRKTDEVLLDVDFATAKLIALMASQ